MASNADPRIHWLGTTECHDARRVGAKAAHLSRLAADFLVPPGFCVVPVDAAAGNGADEDGFEAQLTAVSDALTEAYRTLAARCGTNMPAVAVRSSALDEDSAGASFAGQHATYLNVAGPEAVARSVAACWASARSAVARSYRARYGLVQAGTSMPVLVQQLVPADVSAVVFSVNPVSGDQGEVVVNASWGYGESVVGGTVTPDAYAVRRADLAITGRIIADKSRMTVATAGGVAEVQTPGFLRSRSSLTDDQIREAARLACALEAAMGWPVDVECAWAAGRLFLLQCRPITAVGKQ
jgi:phosphoenolpyruvate synthase/pyruvate phosphate dikinase